MFRDDRLEYKNGTLQIKTSESEIPGATVRNDKQKPKRTTKFDFSGTNYDTCTRGHVACMEIMLEEDPELIENICKQAREIVGVRKPAYDESMTATTSTLHCRLAQSSWPVCHYSRKEGCKRRAMEGMPMKV